MSAGRRRGPTRELSILLGWLSLATRPWLNTQRLPRCSPVYSGPSMWHMLQCLLSGAVPPHLEMLSPVFTLPAPHSAWSSCFLRVHCLLSSRRQAACPGQAGSLPPASHSAWYIQAWMRTRRVGKAEMSKTRKKSLISAGTVSSLLPNHVTGSTEL